MKISTRTHRVTRQKIESITSSIERMDQVLMMYGPGIIDLLTETHSLRQVARRVKRSPTYLSQVKNRKQRISWETYCLLVMLLEESENPDKMKSSSRAR
jgi:hypothetical protein